MNKTKLFLEENLYQEGLKYFGHKNRKLAIEIADIWHDDKQNLNERWNEIEKYDDHKGKILDMACGVGTFLFYGLHKGYDVYGIEPENWKFQYMNNKIDEYNYPQEWKKKIIQGIGERLPFQNETFDYIGTYQTLEHVQNLEICLNELVRVLKVGGKMKIQAPDYDSFYEPHYLLPFLPKMNKKLAFLYLKLLGKPTCGLDTLTWTTRDVIIKYLSKYKNLEIIDLSTKYKNTKIMYIHNKYKLPIYFSTAIANLMYFRKVYTFRAEKQINIIIKKVS